MHNQASYSLFSIPAINPAPNMLTLHSREEGLLGRYIQHVIQMTIPSFPVLPAQLVVPCNTFTSFPCPYSSCHHCHCHCCHPCHIVLLFAAPAVVAVVAVLLFVVPAIILPLSSPVLSVLSVIPAIVLSIPLSSLLSSSPILSHPFLSSPSPVLSCPLPYSPCLLCCPYHCPHHPHHFARHWHVHISPPCHSLCPQCYALCPEHQPRCYHYTVALVLISLNVVFFLVIAVPVLRSVWVLSHSLLTACLPMPSLCGCCSLSMPSILSWFQLPSIPQPCPQIVGINYIVVHFVCVLAMHGC